MRDELIDGIELLEASLVQLQIVQFQIADLALKLLLKDVCDRHFAVLVRLKAVQKASNRVLPGNVLV